MADDLTWSLGEWGGLDDLHGSIRRRQQWDVSRLPLNNIPRDQKALESSMKAFAVDPSKNDQHKYFLDRGMELVQVCRTKSLQSQGYSFPPVDPRMPPVDPLSSIENLLRKELEDLPTSDFRVMRDKLFEVGAVAFGVPPFFWDKNLERHMRRPEFKFFPDDEIDPFNRFLKEPQEMEDAIRNRWKTINGYDYCVFKALVGNRACHHARCANCNASGLRWNFGERESTYWRKMICVECQSVYEIKAKRGNLPQKDEKKMDGFGSFHYYHAVQDELRGTPGASQFIAVIDKDPRLSAGGREVWPVFVAKVSHASPQVQPKSFAMPGQRLYSQVSFYSLKYWFYVPCIDLTKTTDMAARVLENHFTKDSNDAEHSTQSSDESPNVNFCGLSFRDRLKRLRKKRNDILDIEQRQKDGEDLDHHEKDMLDSMSQVLGDIEAVQHAIRQSGIIRR